MLKKLILAFVLSALAGPAFAACTNPLVIKDGSAASISMSMTSNADGFCQYNFNMAQINGVVPLMGNGATGTGSPRVTLSNDNTIPTGWPSAANQTSQITQETAINTVLGAQADASCGTATGTCTLQALIKFLNTAATAATPAGNNLIGDVNLRQGGTALSATNGAYFNQLQGNVAVSAANPFPVAGNPYPTGAVPYTATATGTTAATTATLAGAASVTTYICGFSIRANATAAATGNATVTGVITATLNFTQWTAPNASGLGVTEMIFSPCVPASAANTSIAVVSAAPGTGGVVSVTAWGYKL